MFLTSIVFDYCFPAFLWVFFFCVFFLPYSEMTNSFASQTSVPFMMKMTHPACIVVMTTVPFPVDPLVMACIPFVCLCVSLHLSVCQHASVCQPASVCVSACICLCVSMHVCQFVCFVCLCVSMDNCVLLVLTNNYHVCVCISMCISML